MINKSRALCILLLSGSIALNAQNASNPDLTKVVAATNEEIARLQSVVEANPEDLKAHDEYIKAVGIDPSAKIVKQYDLWMKKFPKSVTVPFVIGQAFYKKERADATTYLLKVVAMDPKRGDVYEMLAIDACRWGDYPLNARYHKMALDTDPTNFSFARRYALALKGRDNGEWKQKLRELETKFAGTDNAATALGLIGIFAEDPKEKEAIFLEQMNKYPVAKFPATKNGMSWLASLYLTSAPAKAVALYDEILADTSLRGNISYYKKLSLYANTFVFSEELIKKGNYTEALAELSKISVARNDPASATSKLALMKAQSLFRAGNVAAAYDSVLVQSISKPNDELYEAMQTYGKKLGKDTEQIEADKWQLIEAKSKPAADFDLYAYLEKKNISLKDLRGKTVFLTFWFPGCGPCRVEMLHMEPVIQKFKDKDFAYVGINGLTDQDPYVESFMKNTGFSFTPLQDHDQKIAKTYGVRGYPTNFIIDPNGKIIYTGFMISTPQDKRMLELMIKSVLDRKS